MNLIKFDPFHRNQYVPTVFDSFFNGSIGDMMGSDFATTMPSVNVIETESGYNVEIAAPGLTKEDFKINLDKNRLTISAEKSARNETKEGKVTRREFNYSSFSRSFMLPKSVEKDNITAKYENGILLLSVPKKAEIVQEEKSRTIEIA
jgi:HSP20 family protein